MKYYVYLIFFIISLGLISCNDNQVQYDSSSLPEELIPAKGDKYYGKTLRVNSIEKYASLFPSTVNDIYSQHISSQIYEGLFKYNAKNLSIEPCIAKSYTVDTINRAYTFNLRDDVFFHDNDCFKNGKGRKVTAKDIKFVFEFLCSKHDLNTSPISWRNYIKGANDYYQKKVDYVEGVKIIDEQTIMIELNQSFAGFLNILALNQTSIFPKEALEYYGKKLLDQVAVGTGPFILTQTEGIVKLSKNSNYWKYDEFGNKLPFISHINIEFNDNKKQELADFIAGKLDFISGLPVEEFQNVMGSLADAKEGKNRAFTVQSVNTLQVDYYGFLLNDSIFGDVNLRKALNYAIDREYIATYILEGSALPANEGIVPDINGYPSELVIGYSYEPDLAKKYLKKVRFPSNKKPALALYYNNSGQVNQLVANEIKKQIFKTLGITINLIEIDRIDLVNKIESSELPFWRYGWIADYPDPANFISQFHSKNIDNSSDNSNNFSKYTNPKFDSFFDDAMAESDYETRLKLLAQAENILISEAAVIPLFYATSIRLINPEVVNFHINELEFRDYSIAYFTAQKKKTARVYENIDIN